MPSEDLTAPIECRLHIYPLEKSNKATHIYQALSYVWGISETFQSVIIDEKPLLVTANLHAALLQLRDRTFERIIWVDAICINQKDEEEKSHQIGLMAKIFGLADRVIVYLGEAADDSDQALKIIRGVEDEIMDPSSSKENEKQILELLERPWFQRIWVLQEVGLARRILIMCGSARINGYTFCSGIGKLRFLDEDYLGLQSLVRPTIYLIRGAIFRPEYTFDLLSDISLGELMDMYHSHKATIRHDKVYALLSMSSDGLNSADLLPDYKLPWRTLLQRLVKFILHEKVNVETWDDREISIIKSYGFVLGHISSTKIDDTQYHKQYMDIVFNDTPISLWYREEYGTTWILQASAQIVRPGDLVCLLHGASKPAIIRACKDHFTIIMMAVTLRQRIKVENKYLSQQPSASTHGFSYDFLLVWNWETIPENLRHQARYKDSTEINSLVPEYLATDALKAVRSIEMALALGGTRNYENAQTTIMDMIEDFELILGKENLHILSLKDSLALVHKMQGKWKDAEILFLEVIRIRQDLQGAYHPDTLSSKAKLVGTYMGQNQQESGAIKGGMLTRLTDKIRGNNQIEEEDLIHIARSFHKELMHILLDLKRENVIMTEEVVKAAAGNEKSGKEVMMLLLENRGAEVVITEEVVKAAAKNSNSGEEVMILLLEKRGVEVVITEEVVKAAAGNYSSGREVMMLLLEKRGAEVMITEEVVKAVVGGFDEWVMMLLLEKRGAEVVITEEVVKAAAGNEWKGEEIMMLLLEKRGAEVVITEEVVKAAAGNERSGKKVVILLLENRGAEVVITEEVVKAAAGNYSSGKEVMMLLLEKRGVEVVITEEVVKAAVGNPGSGKEVMMLLLEKRGAEVMITEEVVKAAAGNWKSGKEVMMLLLEKRGAEVVITEEVVKAAAGNEYNGKKVMMLLLEKRGAVVMITEDILKAAATSGQEQVLHIIDTHLKMLSSLEKWFMVAQFYNASKRGEKKKIQSLLKRGVEPDLPSPRKVTPLWIAATNGHIEVVRLLLETKSVNVNVRSVDGRSPIFWAAAQGHEEIVKLLLSAGADPTFVDTDGGTALLISKQYGRRKIVDMLSAWKQT
ncbi:putative het domain protein [Botrytis cinerea BcDW1]|uniref:Putative het domain protein n=1 Tax=Botryotinia fuckeliana (strain BcDW1) TaxID=1290391 RepID=M7ULF8_BOTF1|nr:putative het domain protein [Botrytis cinerea BcDW1]